MKGTINFDNIILDAKEPKLTFGEIQLSEDYFKKIMESGEFITRGDEGTVYKINELNMLSPFIPESGRRPVCLKKYHNYHEHTGLYFTHIWNPTSGYATILRIGQENSFSTTYVERPLIFWQQVLRVVASICFPEKMPKFYASFIGKMPGILSSRSSFNQLSYAGLIQIAEYVKPDRIIEGLLGEMRLRLRDKGYGYEEFFIREEFDKRIGEIVGKQAARDIAFFKAAGLNLGHWQANTTGEKYYEIWPQIDYVKFYNCICTGYIDEVKQISKKQQDVLFICFKKLLFYNALVVFERKRLRYEMFNQDFKSFSPEQLEIIADQMWCGENERPYVGVNINVQQFYGHLQGYATELAKDMFSIKVPQIIKDKTSMGSKKPIDSSHEVNRDVLKMAKGIFKDLIVENIKQSKSLNPAVQSHFSVLGSLNFEGFELNISIDEYIKIQRGIEKIIDKLFGEHFQQYSIKALVDKIQKIMKLSYL